MHYLLILFLFGFYGPSRLFHSLRAESIIRWGENGRSQRINTWQNLSCHMWPKRGSKPQRWDKEWFRSLKISGLIHSATVTGPPSDMVSSVAYLISQKWIARHNKHSGYFMDINWATKIGDSEHPNLEMKEITFFLRLQGIVLLPKFGVLAMDEFWNLLSGYCIT